MTDLADNSYPELCGRLLRLADRLAEAYGRPTERPLHAAGAQVADDRLLVVAVLGGKEVGKTTLINAMIGREVAGEKDVLRGTETITACTHQDAEADCARRLAGCGPAVLRKHDVESLRHLVLLDMPDFDSDFLEHRDIVLRSLPRLDRVVWLVSHEKYANRSLIDLVKQCGQSPVNFLFVLNKLDLVAAAHGRDVAAAMTRDFAGKLALHLGRDDGNPADRVFGISAMARDFDFARLRECVLTTVDVSEIRQTRSMNRLHALATDLRTLDRTYPLASDLAKLEEVGELLSGRIERLAAQWAAAGQAVLTGSPGLIDEWGRRVFRIRIAAWPLLSVPFGSLLAGAGRLAGLRVGRWNVGTDRGLDSLVDDVLQGAGRPPLEAVSECWQSIRQSRLDLAAVLRVAPPYPWQPEACLQAAQEIRSALAVRMAECRTDLLNEVQRSTRRGAALRWLMLLVPLVWFPLVQPILAASLDAASRPGSLTGWMKLAYTAVLLLGATHWLKSLGVLAAVYGLMALAVFTRARRTARRAVRRGLLKGLRALFVERLETALRAPVDARVITLQEASREFDEIRRRLQ